MLRYLSIFYILLLPTSLFCMESNVLKLINQADSKKLADHPYWHKLLHYHPSFFSSSLKSEVKSNEYFLASDGHKNPKSELDDTIKAFFRRPGKNINDHPQCRFVSRYNWLKKVLNWKGVKAINYNCPEYNKWTQNHTVESISMVFVTGYLESPASFFGHSLLKFNFKNKQDTTNLMDMSVNYGAFTPMQVNPFAYAIKGIFGGYAAGFTHLNFFYSYHNYAEVELRDLWEYELNLNKDQRNQIIAHAWDLLGMKFPYYFFSDNCASRMAELLELELDFKLLPHNVPYALPYKLFEQLNHLNLVKKFHFIPSRHTRVTNKYSELSKSDQQIIKNIIENPQAINEENYQGKKDIEKFRLLETLFDYYSFRIVQDKDNEELKKRKKDLLIERMKLPVGSSKWKESNASPPHQWHPPALAQLSLFHSQEFDLGGSFRWRPAYYDLLAMDKDRLGELSIFDLEGSYADKKIWLDYLDIIKLTSLNISHTDLPGDGGMAWGFRFGGDNQNLSCRSCLTLRLEGQVGKAISLSKRIIIYSMLNTRAQTEVRNSGHFALEPKLASLLNLAKFWNSHIKISRRFYLNGNKSKEYIYSWENTFSTSRKWDVTIAFKHFVDEQIKTSFTYFW